VLCRRHKGVGTAKHSKCCTETVLFKTTSIQLTYACNDAGPPLDTELLALRACMLSNRFLSPLLLQQQHQQLKRR
jgi:hypothetical protein